MAQVCPHPLSSELWFTDESIRLITLREWHLLDHISLVMILIIKLNNSLLNSCLRIIALLFKLSRLDLELFNLLLDFVKFLGSWLWLLSLRFLDFRLRLARLRFLVRCFTGSFLLFPFRRLRLERLFEIVLGGGFDILDFVPDLRKAGRLVHLIDFIDVLEVFVLGQCEGVFAAIHIVVLLLLLLESLLSSSLLLGNELFGRHLARPSEFKFLASHGAGGKGVATGASFEDLTICLTVGCKDSHFARYIRFRDRMVMRVVGIIHSRICWRRIGHILPYLCLFVKEHVLPLSYLAIKHSGRLHSTISEPTIFPKCIELLFLFSSPSY